METSPLLKKLWKSAISIWDFWKRIAAHEARITKIEERLTKQPPEACPKCGELAMRLSKDWGVKGEAGKQWRQDDYKCEKCNYTQPRIVTF